MRKNFERLRRIASGTISTRDPRVVMRIILGVLVAANLIAVWLVVSPPGGSAEDLEGQLQSKRIELQQRKAQLDQSRAHRVQIDKSRTEAQAFETEYFTSRRAASSTFVAELSRAATESGMRPKEHSFLFDPVEGSDVLTMMTITAGYEGTYTDLLEFISHLDRSKKFLILDSLGATPQQNTGLLNVTLKLNAFVKELPGQS